MSDFWSGTNQNVNGEAKIGGADPMPKGTTLLAAITSVKWNGDNPNSSSFDPDEPEFIELKWTAIQGEHTGRCVFQKLRVLSRDEKKAARAKNTLAAIDFNCGGLLFRIPEIPSDESMALSLVGKSPMNIKLEVWHKTNDDGSEGEIGGNWVCNVSGNGQQAQQQETASQQVLRETVHAGDAQQQAPAETPEQELARLRAASSQHQSPAKKMNF